MTRSHDVVVRWAAPDDYVGFTRLFPELQVDDPLPARELWTWAMVPSTFVAARGQTIVGYCYFQEYVDCGYLRNVVVAPGARRRGVGRELMTATADHLRTRGKISWRLNVKPDNHPALALYARMGMQTQHAAKVLRLPWAALPSLPGGGGAQVRDLSPDRDPVLEDQFALPRGQLTFARAGGRSILEAVSSGGAGSIGLAVFNAHYPGAFPFRAKQIDAVVPLLAAMQPHVHHDYIQLVVEDDQRLATLLVNVGATLRDEILHLRGALSGALDPP
jgi:GNAT superfamily N-acetyltransferase